MLITTPVLLAWSMAKYSKSGIVGRKPGLGKNEFGDRHNHGNARSLVESPWTSRVPPRIKEGVLLLSSGSTKSSVLVIPSTNGM